MLVKECIDKFVEKNSEIKQFIKDAYRKGADDAIVDFAQFLEQSNYNSALGLFFASALQLGDAPSVYEQYELKDIERLYDSLIEVNESFVDLYTDAANFADAVMDDQSKAKKIIELGINKLKAQLEELQQLSDSIDFE